MAKSVGLSHQDMYHPDVSAHIDNHLNGDGTSTLGEPSLVQASHPQAPQRPQTSQGYDATRSVAPTQQGESYSPFSAKKPHPLSDIESAVGAGDLGAMAGYAASGGGPVGLAAGGIAAGTALAVHSVARDIYHETDNSPEAAQRAQSRIRK